MNSVTKVPRVRIGQRNTFILCVVMLCLAGAIYLMYRSGALPNPAYVPQMAEKPIQLPDGRVILVQKYEVSVAEWNVCHAEGSCSEELRPKRGMSATETPATELNYLDIRQYVDWISQRANHPFRLPTTQEWEHMARDVLPEKPDPIFTDPSLRWASDYLISDRKPRSLKKKGSFSVNLQGVADLDGSVWEWTDDCYAGENGKTSKERCPAFYVAGEHIAVIPFLVRDPARGGCAVGTPPPHLGFRLVTDKML
ncbi:SUMF1/EgtB/PvdO family nonheme iron enzyme [uncultured Cohaesibacter sp.]|uniref:formylglycine-generating enzyme family protein n=1 Tax=uncultured Cohaesibacter sp. TaxID=1002546 RepID=UPI0029C6B5F7|nr:SUMF1/EgtB/PvdO family nonheme iron enzyme [uncultured Cohaesibacter sp.]